ncbi:hypothetical protein [Actinomycetospora termitidis]|uniref:Uncharacterized protein n=1 Tax=Actinomycetospora termitidis TaxID=3053470 RepID=A0ABT7M132_9PSEU|nr:hypothetical protein [Actinomycetospora sp. Odt1-22]MDL5154369.1 hypothetical protein [Actinomycetospora sp. Odt1-22]
MTVRPTLLVVGAAVLGGAGGVLGAALLLVPSGEGAPAVDSPLHGVAPVVVQMDGSAPRAPDCPGSYLTVQDAGAAVPVTGPF